MTDDLPPTEDSYPDEALLAVLEEYYRRLAEQGDVDRDAFLAEFAQFREQLLGHFSLTDTIAKLPAGSASPARSESTPRTIRYFGNYELLDEIARGGMGVVYRARQVNLKRIVAVKTILAGQFASAEDITRFRHEAEAAAALHHPNIVTIFEVGQHDGQHFFSMEYVEGSDLSKLVREGPLNPFLAAEHVRTVAIAIAAMHDAGILHRDLKPSNVLVEVASGRLRITDFGLSKRLNNESLRTSTGRIMGTPSYMSPEQAAGRGKEIGPATDIYALGAILYELTTARPPFVGETPWDTASQVQQSEVVRPRLLNPRVPRDLETICLKCLEKAPARRYDRAQDLADDLSRFLSGQPIKARSVSPVEKAYRWGRRNAAFASVLGVAAAGLIALLITLAIFGVVQREHAQELSTALDTSRQRQHTIQTQLAEAQRDKAIELCRQGDPALGTQWLANSLKSAPDDAAALRESIGLNLAAWKDELLEKQGVFPGEGRNFAFSPGGNRFATSTGKSALVRASDSGKALSPSLNTQAYIQQLELDADGEALLLRPGGGLWREKSGAWTSHSFEEGLIGMLGHRILPDGTVFVAKAADGGNEVWDVVAEKAVGPRLNRESGEPGFTVIGPDGKYAVTRVARDRVQIWDISSGKTVGKPLPHSDLVTLAAFLPDGQTLLTAANEKAGRYESLPQAFLWDVQTGERLGDSFPHYDDAGGIRSARFSRDGRRIFTRTPFSLRAWDRTAKPITPRIPTFGDIDQWAVDRDGRTLAYLTPSQEVRLWDVDANRGFAQPLASGDRVALSADGQYLLKGNEREGQLWKLPRRSLAAGPLVHSEDDTGDVRVIFDSGGERALAYRHMSARLWNVHSGEQIGPTVEVAEGIAACDLSPDGRWLATASLQNFSRPGYRGVRVYDLQTGKGAERALPRFEDVGHHIQFTRDGRKLVVAGDSGLISIYDMQSDKVVVGPLQHPMPDYDGATVLLAVSPDQRRLASVVLWEGDVLLWDIASGKKLAALRMEKGGNRGLVFSPNGKFLAAAGSVTAIWDVQSHRQLVPGGLVGPSSLAVAFAPDSRTLATSHQDGTVQRWDISKGTPILPALRHPEAVSQIAFIGNGEMLLTCSQNGEAQLWHCSTGVPVGPLLAPCRFAAVSEDGRLIAGATAYETRIWRVPVCAKDD